MKISDIAHIVSGLAIAAALLPVRAQADHPSAEQILARSMKAAQTVPMRARLSVTTWRGDRTVSSLARYAMAADGSNRLEYEAPPSARGRIVYVRGRERWQLDPNRKLMRRSPVSTESDSRLSTLREKNYVTRLSAKQSDAGGRRCYVVEIVPRSVGKGFQRRWIDRATFRCLRTETHFADGGIASVIAYQQIELPASVAADSLPIRPAKDVRTETSAGRDTDVPTSEAVRLAAQYGLADQGDSFEPLLATRAAGSKETHFVLSDGLESVSVFVRPASRTSLRGWRQEDVAGTTVHVREASHLGMARWTRGGMEYTAVSHLEHRALRRLVESWLRRKVVAILHPAP